MVCIIDLFASSDHNCNFLIFFSLVYLFLLYFISVKVTPKAIRLRKKYLDVNKRKSMSKKPKE